MKVVAIVEKAYRSLTPCGGAETMIADMLEYLSNTGWQVTALILNGSEFLGEVNGVTVVRTQDKERVYELAKEADVVLTQLGGTPRARLLGQKIGRPVSQLIHNTNEYSVGFLGDGTDLAIYNSRWVRDYHKLHSQDPVIRSWEPGGSSYLRKRSCTEWPSIVVRPPVTKEYRDIGDRDGYITLINLVENKGSLVMYELAKRNPGYSFMGVIGGYSPANQIIREMPNVLIHDHVQDIDEIFKKTSILIMPSTYESYGLAAVEAMGRGIPVIASDTPGLKEALHNSHLHRATTDFPGWEQAIEWVYNNYDFAKDLARDRYNDLLDQTRADMALFADKMEELVNTWGSSRSKT